MDIVQAKKKLDNIIRKSRVHLYKPIQIAEILYQDRVYGGIQLSDLETRITAGDNRRALIEQYTNLDHLTREMVEILIDYIVAGKRAPGEKDPPVEIHWNF